MKKILFGFVLLQMFCVVDVNAAQNFHGSCYGITKPYKCYNVDDTKLERCGDRRDDDYICYKGYCLQCDTHQQGEYYECSHLTIAVLGDVMFQCKETGDDDYWETYKMQPCSGVTEEDLKKYGRKIRAASSKPDPNMSGVYLYDAEACWEPKATVPVKPPVVPKSCKSQRKTDEGRACCDLPPEVAEWKNQQCICTGGKDFKINNGIGTCVAPEKPDVPFACPPADITLFNQWTVQCASHSATISLITQIKMLCSASNLTADQYNTLYAQVVTSVALNCQQTVVQPVVQPEPVIDNNSKNKIIAAGRVLDGIAAGFDVSVWKNAQGEFNTARLASDSIAGVVLGTVGGVVTSSVMKKHQVEDGFEDLKCTIGGQPVAGWGDEFNVGVQ